MIRAIFAVTDDNVVGYEGKLPWPHSKIDMSWFVNNTRGDMVFMGSSTWLAPDMKTPLPNRPNVVISSQDQDKFEGAEVITDVNDIQEYRDEKRNLGRYNTKWIIGGGNVLKQTQSMVEEYYITRFHGELEDYRSEIDESEVIRIPLDFMLTKFRKTFERKHKELTFEIWKRIK